MDAINVVFNTGQKKEEVHASTGSSCVNSVDTPGMDSPNVLIRTCTILMTQAMRKKRKWKLTQVYIPFVLTRSFILCLCSLVDDDDDETEMEEEDDETEMEEEDDEVEQAVTDLIVAQRNTEAEAAFWLDRRRQNEELEKVMRALETKTGVKFVRFRRVRERSSRRLLEVIDLTNDDDEDDEVVVKKRRRSIPLVEIDEKDTEVIYLSDDDAEVLKAEKSKDEARVEESVIVVCPIVDGGKAERVKDVVDSSVDSVGSIHPSSTSTPAQQQHQHFV